MTQLQMAPRLVPYTQVDFFSTTVSLLLQICTWIINGASLLVAEIGLDVQILARRAMIEHRNQKNQKLEEYTYEQIKSRLLQLEEEQDGGGREVQGLRRRLWRHLKA